MTMRDEMVVRLCLTIKTGAADEVSSEDSGTG